MATSLWIRARVRASRVGRGTMCKRATLNVIISGRESVLSGISLAATIAAYI